ncbi:MAG: hypothetical protein ACRD9R_11470, partial [Pyrinomonadaceae bacterium]
LKRGHVPILNVKYVNDACGPFRDWQYQENMFQADGADVAPGVRAATRTATTIIETGNDTGNFRGVAYYTEGTKVVLVSELTAGWYRYISEWGFDADGTIYPRFGYGATTNTCVCADHYHHVYWRFDFDINGTDNQVYETRNPRGFVTLPFATEARRYRDAKRPVSWVVQNPSTGDAYMIRPNSNDGYALQDVTGGYARGDLWVLRYRATEIDDRGVAGGTQVGLDSFVNNEPVVDKDIVVWYGGHLAHLDDTFSEIDLAPSALSGPRIHGPNLIPIKW